MDIKVVDSVGQEVKPEVPKEIVEPDMTPVKTGELEVNAIGSLFDLKPTEIGEYMDKINTLLDYAKSQTEDHSRENLIWAIRDLEYKVGTPALGEKLINYLSRYAYLKLEQQKLDKEVKKYEHNNQ